LGFFLIKLRKNIKFQQFHHLKSHKVISLHQRVDCFNELIAIVLLWFCLSLAAICMYQSNWDFRNINQSDDAIYNSVHECLLRFALKLSRAFQHEAHTEKIRNTTLGCRLWEVKNSGCENSSPTEVKCTFIYQNLSIFIAKSMRNFCQTKSSPQNQRTYI
jgi:hypothetical protein